MSKESQRYQYNNMFFKKWVPVYDTLGLIIKTLRTRTAELIKPDTSLMIDVACGTGAQSIAFARKGISVIGIDISEDMLKQARKKVTPDLKIRFINMDAAALSFKNGSFDAASISLGLHDMPENTAKDVLREMVRVTKPGGQIIVVDYNTPQVWWGYAFMKLWESQYYGNFMRVGLDNYLMSAGLSPEKSETILLGNFQIVECINCPRSS